MYEFECFRILLTAVFAGLFPCTTAIWLAQACRYMYLPIFLSTSFTSDGILLTRIKYGFLQLQRAAKLLDSGAVRATRFLWRYPVARVLLLFYLVRTGLFATYLILGIYIPKLRNCILRINKYYVHICRYLYTFS